MTFRLTTLYKPIDGEAFGRSGYSLGCSPATSRRDCCADDSADGGDALAHDVGIEQWRDDAPRLVAVPGSSVEDVAALALAFYLDTAIAPDAYRLTFAADRVTLAFLGSLGGDRGLPKLAQIAKGRFSEIGFKNWPCKVVVGWTLPSARNGTTCLSQLLRRLPLPAP